MVKNSKIDEIGRIGKNGVKKYEIGNFKNRLNQPMVKL